MCMGRCYKLMISLCVVSLLILVWSCKTKPEPGTFMNVCAIPDSVATPEQLEEKQRLMGFFYNSKVLQFRGGRIEHIADSSLYIKNNVDIRYMSYVLAQIEETNTGCIRMFNDGELPKDSFSILLEKAFCEAQRKHAREIVE